MRAAVRLLTIGLALGPSATQSMPNTGAGIYAIVDEVAFEPSDFEPDRVWISGTFVVPVPVSSGNYRPPSRGHLYFSLNPEAPTSTRTDWEALRKVAGTGQVVGFANYWMPCSNSRARFGNAELALPADANCSLEVSVHVDRGTAVPEPYPAPSSEGVVTILDRVADLCSRFSEPLARIIVALRGAHSPSRPQDEPPVCVERGGLVSPSRLDSEFVAQTRDPEWADTTEAFILRRLAEAPDLGLLDLGVECRDTICRIRLVFPSREYQETTGNTLVADALSELPGFAPGGKIIPPRDEPNMHYYLQRGESSALRKR